jgi:hypothetical protein
MAKTTINLSDTVSAWVTKTNQISNSIGDLVNLNTTVDSDIVGAINELKVAVDRTDSSDVINLARNNLAAVDAGGDGSFAYDSANGKFTYTGPSASEVRAHLNGGAGIVYSSSTGNISVDSSEVRELISVTDAGGSGSLTYNNSTGVFTYTGPGATTLPSTITSTQTFTPSTSDDQYVRVDTSSGDITLSVAVGSLVTGQSVVVDKIAGGNNLTISWAASSQGISLGNSVELAVGFYNGTAFSFVETVKS